MSVLVGNSVANVAALGTGTAPQAFVKSLVAAGNSGTATVVYFNNGGAISGNLCFAIYDSTGANLLGHTLISYFKGGLANNVYQGPYALIPDTGLAIASGTSYELIAAPQTNVTAINVAYDAGVAGSTLKNTGGPGGFTGAFGATDTTSPMPAAWTSVDAAKTLGLYAADLALPGVASDAWPGAYTTGTNILNNDTNWSGAGPASTNFNVQVGGLVMTSGGASSGIFWNAGVAGGWTASQWSEITCVNAVSSTVQIGPSCCVATPGASCSYYFLQIKGGSGSPSWEFRRVSAGTETLLGSNQTLFNGGAFSPQAGDIYTLQVAGTAPSTLTFFKNGTAASFTVTDTMPGIAANQSPGIHQFLGQSGKGDITVWRGGNGTYPGLTGPPGLLLYAQRKVLYFI